MWVTFTLTRLDRLHARVDAAQAALDAQLVRRAAALLHVAESPDSGLPDDRASRATSRSRTRALGTPEADAERQDAENAVGPGDQRARGRGPSRCGRDAAAELHEAAARVLIARRFYNDAVRDTRALRGRRMPRLLRLAGRRAMPQFFDIDDTVPTACPRSVRQPRRTPHDSTRTRIRMTRAALRRGVALLVAAPLAPRRAAAARPKPSHVLVGRNRRPARPRRATPTPKPHAAPAKNPFTGIGRVPTTPDDRGQDRRHRAGPPAARHRQGRHRLHRGGRGRPDPARGHLRHPQADRSATSAAPGRAIPTCCCSTARSPRRTPAARTTRCR